MDTDMGVGGFMGHRCRFLLWGLHRRITIIGKEGVGGLVRLIYLFTYLVTFSLSIGVRFSVSMNTAKDVK